MKMNQILEKYKLTKTFEVDLDVDKEVFIRIFKEMIQKGFYSPFLVVFDDVKPGDKKYIGRIHPSHFKIRERFVVDKNASNNLAIVQSEFYTDKTKLKVKTKIIGMEFLPFILRVVFLGIYLLAMLLVIIEACIPPIEMNYDISYILPIIIVTLVVFVLTYVPYKNAKINVKEKEKDIKALYLTIERKN